MNTFAGLTQSATPPKLQEPAAPAMSKEIERKWLVLRLPDLTGLTAKEITQGYIAITADGTEVRLRQKGNKYYQTIKTDGDLERSEVEIELSKEQFDQLWPATAGKRIEKLRYEIPQAGLKIELDVYKGSLAGLLVAEVEFKSIDQGKQFVAPEWFGREVTEDKRYKNKNLAIEGVPA